MRRFILPLACLMTVSACAHDRYGYGPPQAPYGYDGGEWSGRGMDDLYRPDPWLQDTREGRMILERHLARGGHPEAIRELNIRFRQFADTNGDARLTDREIREALVRCAAHGWNR